MRSRLFILLAVCGMLWPMPLAAAQKTPDLRGEVAAIAEDLRTLQIREAKLAEKQRTLAAEIQEIKTAGAGNFLQDLRLKHKLRELRDLLNEEVALGKKGDDLRDLLSGKKDALREEIRSDVRKGLDRADAARRLKRPDETWERYREIDVLLREYETLAGSEVPADSNPRIPTDNSRSERPDRPRDTARTLAFHADRLDREVRVLEKQRTDLSTDLALKKGLSRFQGILERSVPGTPSEEIPIENESRIRKGERQMKDLERRIRDTRELRKALLERARALETEAARTDRPDRGKKR